MESYTNDLKRPSIECKQKLGRREEEDFNLINSKEKKYEYSILTGGICPVI